MNPAIQIIGAQPEDGSQIPGIRKWAPEYLPRIYQGEKVDLIEYVSQADAEEMARRLAVEEGIFCGISAGGALVVALRIARQVENATIVFIVCDRGDRYLSTGVFPASVDLAFFFWLDFLAIDFSVAALAPPFLLRLSTGTTLWFLYPRASANSATLCA